MKRLVYQELIKWKDEEDRKPILLRGARQVGKTHSVRYLKSFFSNYVEINFEFNPGLSSIFEKDLDPEKIINDLYIHTKKKIIPGKTLLFLDEVQECPRAIISLRYFYEMMPELHVIAAGSLLEFAIQKVGIPVGRVTSLYMYPLSFLEFLVAMGEELLIREILKAKTFPKVLEDTLISLLGVYIAIGGMPEAVSCWIKTKDPQKCHSIHHSLIDTYKQDFQKYAKEFQLKYLDLLIEQIPRLLGKRFIYSHVGDYRKRELSPCLDLLVTANILYKIYHSSGNGVPIGAEAKLEKFKAMFLDIGLTQASLNLDLSSWFLRPQEQLVNKGEIIEAFVGQEILAYSSPYQKNSLYYWQREERSSSSEVDYIIQKDNHIIPIEVKSGKGSTLRSLHMFLDSHPKTPYGIKCSILNHSRFKKVLSIPLYSVALINESYVERIKFLISDVENE